MDTFLQTLESFRYQRSADAGADATLVIENSRTQAINYWFRHKKEIVSDDPRVLNFLFQFDEFASPDKHLAILMAPDTLSSPWLQQSVTAIGELFVIYPGFDIPYEMLVFVQQVVNFLKSTKSSYIPKSVKDCWMSLEFRFMVERITYWALTFMDDRIGDSNRIRQNNPTTKQPTYKWQVTKQTN